MLFQPLESTAHTSGEIQVYGWSYNDFRNKYDELWNQGWPKMVWYLPESQEGPTGLTVASVIPPNSAKKSMEHQVLT